MMTKRRRDGSLNSQECSWRLGVDGWELGVDGWELGVDGWELGVGS